MTDKKRGAIQYLTPGMRMRANTVYPGDHVCKQTESAEREKETVMPVLEYTDGKIQLDDEGFLENPDDGTKGCLCFGGKRRYRRTYQDRMDIIRFLRDHYRKYNFFPVLKFDLQERPSAEGMHERAVHDPLTAWKVAGLPGRIHR